MKKNIIKVLLFIFIFLILFHCVTKILWNILNPITYFYKEPKDSMDIVYIGSSNAYAHFNSVLAYNLYGYTTGLFSADSQYFGLVKSCLKEVEKYQKPSLYIIDIAKIANGINDFTNEELRNTIDSMKISKNRIDTINEVLANKKVDKDDYINYYFSFLMYHNSWKFKGINAIKTNIFGRQDLYKGYLFGEFTSNITPQEKYNWSNDMQELNMESKEVLISLLDYIKSKSLNVLFVLPRRGYGIEENKEINSAIKIIENNNFKVINFNTLSDFDNIDFSKDLYNFAHLNVYGATKYTTYFAKYLKENYQLKDHRGDKKYNSWKSEYERFKQDFKKINNTDFDEFLKNNVLH